MATDRGPRFKSIKSLPVDYRFKGEKGSSGDSGMSVSIPENGSGNMDRVVEDDLPYGHMLIEVFAKGLDKEQVQVKMVIVGIFKTMSL